MLLEIIASKIATAVLGAGVGTAARAVMPGPGTGIATPPKTPRLKFSKPGKVETSDIERLSKHVERSLQALTQQEFRDLPENERLAAVGSAAESFAASGIDIWDCDLDPEIYASKVIRQSEAVRRASGLSDSALSFYEILIHHISLQLVQFITSWPTFSSRVEVEQLKRLGLMTAAIEKIHDTLGPDLRSSDIEFESKYCNLVDESLDHLQIFGIDLADRTNRSYNLTTAYITLSVVPASSASVSEPDLFGAIEGGGDSTDSVLKRRDAATSAVGMRAEAAISSFKRILLRGDAGSGKTTLLQWLSVNAARRSFDGGLADWNALIPFVLPLRRFANGDLPTPSGFFPEVGTHLAEEMPDKWVNRMLRAGRALVLIDGVDELPSAQREPARKWLRDLIKTYPSAHYIVTSRPAAAETFWLSQDGFVPLDMLPMSQKDVENFVRHWHDAASANETDEHELDALSQGQIELISSIREERQLKRLASNPLLCALLCTLNRDRHSQLPRDRMELYRAALDMLLLRRDRERKIDYPEPPNIGDAQKKSILGSFAYWLIRNGLSDSSQLQTVKQIEISLQSMPSIASSPDDVFDYLLVRSGCLRRPVEGRVDFVHRTFQEFLAAARIVEVDDIEILLSNAHLDQWHEVVVMAVGHARPAERTMILEKLLDRGEAELANRGRLHLLAAACLETAGECSPEIYERVKKATARLIPPRRMGDAKELASAGDMVIPLIPERRLSAAEAAATVRMASIVGGDGALSLVSRFSRDGRVTVKRELERAWQYFDSDEFAEKILVPNAEEWRELSISLPDMLRTVHLFPHLEALDVFCNAESMDWLPELHNLTALTLRNFIDRFSYASLSRCPNLTNVVLAVGKSEDDIIELQLLDHLAVLGVISGDRGNQIASFPSLPKLTSLYLHGFGCLSLASVVIGCPEVQHVSFDSTDVTGFESLECLVNLKSLSMYSCNVDQARVISGLASLRSLTIRDRKIQDSFDLIASNSSLRTISLAIPMGFRGEVDIRPFLVRERSLSLRLRLSRECKLIGGDDRRVKMSKLSEIDEGNVEVWQILIIGTSGEEEEGV